MAKPPMKPKAVQKDDEDLKSPYGRLTLDEWATQLGVSYDELVAHVDDFRNRDAIRGANHQTPHRSLLYSKLIAAKMLAFLVEYQDTGLVTQSAATIKSTARTIRQWRNSFPMFAELCGDLQESMVDVAEDELYKRAIVGEDVNVYHQGQVVDTIKEKSNDLLKYLLNANRHKFRAKSEVAMTGAGGGPIQVEELVNVDALRDKLFERILTRSIVKG